MTYMQQVREFSNVASIQFSTYAMVKTILMLCLTNEFGLDICNMAVLFRSGCNGQNTSIWTNDRPVTHSHKVKLYRYVSKIM